MTDTYAAPIGAPTWIDLATSDPDGAQRFYGAVFGWTFESLGPEYGGYVNAFAGGRPVAGLVHNDPQWRNGPDAWSTYLHVADIEAATAAAIAAGGMAAVTPMEVPAKGWMAVLADPAGAVFGLWQPTGHRGFEAVGVPGAPVWHQLTTTDFDGTLGFYRTVFDWQYVAEADTPEFRYSNATFDGEPLVGVMDASVLPPGTPSTWTVFLGAADVDATVEVITANGGTVIRAAEDTPYGRLAAVTDPTGAGFNLASLDR